MTGVPHLDHFIDGRAVPSTSPDRIDVVDPTTEAVVATVPSGTAADADAAVRAARAAYAAWSSTPAAQRADALRAVAARLRDQREHVANAITREVGMPLQRTLPIQVDLGISSLEESAALAATYDFERVVGNSLLSSEPVGVVAAIAPWNYPLDQAIYKVGPALAAGCTVVLKPSEVAPTAAAMLALAADQAGLPPGVLNVLHGGGSTVGEPLVRHRDVDMVSFTGSTAAGIRVSELAAAGVKRIALELGGKSANVLLDDADFEAAVGAGVANAFMNAGQTCTALTRMIVPRKRLDEVERLAVHAAQTVRVGNPFDDGIEMGPLVSSAQRDRVLSLIEQGVREGARLLTGGTATTNGGFFVRPTVLSDVTSDMIVAQTEIFGPVLSILAYDDEDEAIRIANDSEYGLAGGVWSGDAARARRVAARIRTGQIAINGARPTQTTPHGGFKRSGLGREFGVWGLEEYLELKVVHVAEGVPS